MSTIEFKSLGKRFGQKAALRDINLWIEHGEFVVLVGPSGCGKTTLLRILAGLEPATQGQVLINGRDMTDALPSERGLAMVFQSYALYPHMTVRENLSFGLRMRGLPKAQIQARLSKAIDILKLQDLTERRPGELSGGQCQRVAIGRAIVQQPGAFLFDEPLSNLDAELRLHLRLELIELHRELGTTMVCVTHDQIEAMTMADRIVVLREGSVEQVGPPSVLYHQPANRFVAQFMGSPPMNVYPVSDVALPPGFAVPAHVGTWGVRPEHLTLNPHGALPLQLTHVEHLGASHGLHGTVAGTSQRMCVLTSQPVQARPGDMLRVSPLSDRIHWFDHQDRRLEPPPTPSPN